MHGSFDTHFPLKSELRIQKLKFKSQLIGQQSSFVKPNTLSKAPTVVSLRVSHLLAKHKKSFVGEIKKVFLEASNSLFDSFKIKTEIISAIKDIQLLRRTVTRRIAMMNSDLADQLTKDITNCICFSLQFDKSGDVIDISQPCIFVRMVFQDMSIKELLTILHLKKKTRGKAVYCAFKKYIEEKNIPIYKVVSMTLMSGIVNEFLAMCMRDDGFPHFLSYHCIIHQQAQCCKILNMRHVMEIWMKIVYSIRGRSL
ncbi:DUF4371 domain-containing protein [Trichonephila clavipes]|nr:DUF4371 domain-containing protein [Trichonephila clavipes]